MKNRLTYFVKWARQFARQFACLGIALAVAYALALQIILASVVASGTAAAPDGTAALCYANTDDSGDQPWRSPAHLADCALSCAQGFGAAAILPDVAAVVAFAPGDTIKGAQLAALDVSQHPSPKLAQGPPSNT